MNSPVPVAQALDPWAVVDAVSYSPSLQARELCVMGKVTAKVTRREISRANGHEGMRVDSTGI